MFFSYEGVKEQGSRERKACLGCSLAGRVMICLDDERYQVYV